MGIGNGHLMQSILFVLVCVTSINAFTSTSKPITSTKVHRQKALYSSPSDDEIADLEKKLQELKEKKKQETAQVATMGASEDVKTFDGSDPLKKPKVTNTKEPVLEMLSESWKEGDEASSEGSSVIVNIGLAVVAIAGFAIFSQVPVGQDDYSKYSSAKSGSQRIDLGDLNSEARKSTEGL
mmetsp:Transcript_26444/g.39110  ORF Transcript_26444/g.39110 Transcript_26444/m.39110 type:complete len:181 (+) Transcript_26444:127-669(+)|eukprot:CAMPEP_0194241324 /NCGR_PEP_ID=MMETSP0158-20130606/7224_1 /TAXON_ID=33649 /ORGANISM="Thalassionema nitzschioides, Strain L26-B" /LENGTH=180 /DNA_ID=CAMNT_0038976189 /DNA_START=68 /DNA_END=610 /DNA_ORIENTATION=-